MKKEVKEEKTSKKKTKIVIIISSILLILLGLFLFWFFNRTYDVTFKVNNTEVNTIKVKYNKTINEKDIKTKEELGQNFIGWYEVISTENNEEVLAKDSFDFSTKIKKDTSLKALYEEEKEEVKVETITITFDTKGGNKVSSITINKGEELTLPKNPTRSGYTFVSWELKNGSKVKDKTAFNEDTTLYANWKKKEEPKKEEKISLSLSRNVIHRNGNKTSKANAKVENASGDITYSIDNNVCVSIDAKTGNLTANNEPTGSGAKIKVWLQTCATDGNVVTVTATLPSGKSASAKLTIEKDLVLYASNSSIKRSETIKENGITLPAYEDRFYVDANQTVTWSAKADDPYGTCKAVNVTTKSTSYTGNLGGQCTDGNARTTLISATSAANQKITIKYYQNIA